MGSGCPEVWKEVWGSQVEVQEKKKLKADGGEAQRRELSCRSIANSGDSSSTTQVCWGSRPKKEITHGEDNKGRCCLWQSSQPFNPRYYQYSTFPEKLSRIWLQPNIAVQILSVTNKKMCLAPLVTMKMQVKARVRSYCTPSKMVRSKQSDSNNCCGWCREIGIL